MEIRYWTAYRGNSFVLAEDNSSTRAIELLSIDSSSATQLLGYRVNGDGTYSIFSSFLSDFIASNDFGTKPVLYKSLRAAINAAAERNRIYYLYTAPKNKVFIDFNSKFASTEVVLEIRRYYFGGLNYSRLINIKLDNQGDGTYVLSNPLLKGDRLRVLVNGTAIKYVTV
jgi:hypothetical protein